MSAAESLLELPGTWPLRAARLRQLLAELAARRALATERHAGAFLKAEGTAQYREQAARKAAAKDVLAAEQAAADVAAYRILLDAAVRAELAPPRWDAGHEELMGAGE